MAPHNFKTRFQIAAGGIVSSLLIVLTMGTYAATAPPITVDAELPHPTIRNRTWLAQAQLQNALPLKTGTYQHGIHYLRISDEADAQCLQAAVSQEELNEALEQIDSEAESASSQLSQAIAEQLTQERDRINALLQDPAVLEATLQSGQLSKKQEDLLEQFRKNPESVETYLAQEAQKETERLTIELARRRSNARAKLREAARAQAKGAWLIAPKASGSIFHSLQASRLVVLPQQGNRLLLGQPENLFPYILVQEAANTTTRFMPCPES